MLLTQVLAVRYPLLAMLSLGGDSGPYVLHVLFTIQALIFRNADIRIAEVRTLPRGYPLFYSQIWLIPWARGRGRNAALSRCTLCRSNAGPVGYGER